jgi:transcriptional regulator with XRE-family HTH domain
MTSQTAIEWYRGLAADPESRVEEAKIDFALCVERRMKHLGLSKAALAQRLATSPAYVTKILRGDANLTIKTMVELAHAVDGTLHLHIAPRQANVRWFEVFQSPPAETAEQIDAGQAWASHRATTTGARAVVGTA